MSANEKTRDRWISRPAFILAAVGSAVGLGNVWRFPQTCYENGGGAFFIPYLVALFTAGIPLLILEFGIGQMMQASAPKSLQKINKHTEWVGWFALLVASVITFYYSAVMAWAVEYAYYAIEGFFNHGQMAWSTHEGGEGGFFMQEILAIADKKEALWQYHIPVLLGLVITWVISYFIICKGVLRVGKVVKYTVPLPVILLVILIIRGATLPGAGEGIRYYLTPDISKLSNPETWLDAYGQIFFSLTLGFGAMIAYASYRPKNSDVANNAFITALCNCATSFIAGFAVFSVIGYLAHTNSQDVSDVVAGGPSLVFVTYPTAVSKMGEFGWYFPPIVGILFFLMLLSLGIDSMFSLIEAVIAALRDKYPSLSQNLLTALFCIFGLLVSIFFFANRAGLLWLDSFDHWANNYGLAIVGLLECLIIGYFFKTDEMRDYINKVSEIKLWGWWELCIKLITPVILIFLLAATLLDDINLGRLYGMSQDKSAPFDSYAWIAPAVFIGLFVIAFAMSKMWTYIYLIILGAIIFAIIYLLLGSVPAALFSALTGSVLIGGFIICLFIARKAKPMEKEEVPQDN